MNGNAKFSTREWILSIIILLIVEAFVFWVAFQFAGNSSALGYVSFAGTLISIILAVLAIGYTYGESQQQKNSSDTLSNQISSLVKIKEKLETQADALEDIKELKSKLTNFSANVDNHFNNTYSKLNIFTDQLKSSHSQSKTQSKEIQNDLNKNEIYDRLFIQQDFKINVISLILFILSFEETDYYEYVPVSLEYLESLEDLDINGFDKGVLYGFSYHLGLTLLRLGYANKDTGYLDQIVIEHFNYVIDNNFETLSTEFDGRIKPLLERAKKSKFYEIG
ncbi:hypothetical protein KW868_16080 [Acinetobacter guillouiae]|uniref:Phage abortive infection protein n=1 Tax=Acinetobacter guillouiae TaxID=106649 RepID=A0A8X8GJL0_ACIGI|nr:hypothetical protein [Acinetobacter guillouiae]MCF0265966.1 hypothetical protein [Acinetobacter guillouiae]